VILAATVPSFILAVNPVPWARAQMAFTLGAHIILVPLGVSWAFMTLVANYRGIKKNDADSLLLAQRWSKYMAVTFAVGAVTGTVLTFEFGLLWPRFMGRFGDAFGIPFAIEGLFFFTEAIFIAIYIYGWKRLKPWHHFWAGVPIVIAGIGGTASVVAANSWMNEPAGFTLNSAGKVVDVDPWAVIFNNAMPYETAHMLVAAYLVGGFLIASVYAAGMLRGRRDRYHRLGFLIPFTVAAIAAPIQMVVGDQVARWVYNNEPTKFAAIELVPKTSSDVPETLFGHLNSQGEVQGGFAIPGLASILSDPSTGTSTVVKGLDAFPKSSRPTSAEVNVVHLAWDVMVGLATLLFLLSAWYWLSWLFRRDMPKARLFLWLASAAGVASIFAMEAGWVVTEVGRQPWIVFDYMKVSQAATGNKGVWATFLVILGLYIGVGVTLVLILRSMSRRWRAQPELAEDEVPYGPREPVEVLSGAAASGVSPRAAERGPSGPARSAESGQR
jgi:cytochrome d ubiquinol oxidase subunit I